ncbi:hypothetical protein P29A0810_090 [Synechococcus phage S-CAM8]|jgi:hypothetical protein|uniref:Gp107 n=1 Tax=Synechococcus phage S-CAM8 TaxID=754038 RepID=G8EXP5_9CAUD|nr:hypothetical protein SXCG_00199 [Synechococcus phage S-CAM8]AET72585.1 hypothetical protein SXFG_00034 [Synechococcus phage S-CAM8]AGN33929.1 hypothetical protein SXCG_00199 [Synechococcus phage S-CAM8]AOV60026.1 hypothetical protein P29A0810_090 [Synechococcus phage S-CAM8]
MTIDKVSKPQMLTEFRERLQKLIAENQQFAAKIKENEATALKLQGAIETLEYYSEEEVEETASHPPDETEE